jgi:hypothetical protein
MKKIFFLAVLSTIGRIAQAQTSRENAPNFYKMGVSADFNIASDSKNALFALSGKQLFGIGNNRRFKIGYGLRLNHNFGSKVQFLTAPAILTTGKTGPIVFFDGTKIDKNIDTLQTTNFSVTSINIPLYLEYAVSNRFDVGFNIDVAGVSFGQSQNDYRSVHSTALNKGSIAGKATSPNLLLVGDNDLGSLNSEIFARYHFNDRLAVNGGVSFVFAEFTTDRKLYLDNDRFRQKQLLGMVGITYRIL